MNGDSRDDVSCSPPPRSTLGVEQASILNLDKNPGSFRCRYVAMPLARRLVIFAIADGLILQNASHSAHLDQHQAVRIEWKTGQLTPYHSTSLDKIREGAYAESHGVVGKPRGFLSKYSQLILQVC